MKKFKLTVILLLLTNMISVGVLIKKEREINDLVETNNSIKSQILVVHESIKNINNTIDNHTNEIKEYISKFNSLKTELIDYGYILE